MDGNKKLCSMWDGVAQHLNLNGKINRQTKCTELKSNLGPVENNPALPTALVVQVCRSRILMWHHGPAPYAPQRLGQKKKSVGVAQHLNGK